MSDPSRHPRRSAAVIVVVALAWLVAAAGVVIAAGADLGGLDAGGVARFVAGLVLRLAPPLAVAVVAVELLRRAGRDDAAELDARTAAARAAGEAVRDGLLDIDATLTAIGGRLADLRAASASEVPQLTEAARSVAALTATLAATTGTTTAAARDLAAVVPAAQAHADRLAATLAATGDAAVRQLGEVETMLAGVFTRHAEVEAQVAAIAAATRAAADAIDARTGALEAAVDHALGRAGAAVDTALTRTAGAVDDARAGVEAQAAATLAAIDAQAAAMRVTIDAHATTTLATIDAARSGLDAIGGTTATTVARRIDHIVAATATLGTHLAEHDARTNAMVGGIERTFAVLDKRLAHATAMGTATLDGFHDRMTAVRVLADAVPPRLDEAVAGLGAVEAAAARLAPAGATAVGIATALARSAGPAARLGTDLREAHAALRAVEEAAHGSALAAANQLIEVLGRVREVAASATGTLRDALAEVVAEAETALSEAGARTAAAAFADPVRHEIAGLEGAAALAGDAAQATADRIAARLLGLTAVVATVEKRLAGVE